YRVFGLLPGFQQAPEDWRGPFPALYVQKGDDRIAFCFHPHDLCLNEVAPAPLQNALSNPGVKVYLVSNCHPCTCGIKQLVQGLPPEQASRVSLRRFVRGRITKPEFLRFYLFGLTVKGWLYFLPFPLIGMILFYIYYCYVCGIPFLTTLTGR
ncbi:MAG: hypothetical protein AABZ64_16410, partial [Nitrospinota bacterium]